jgi:hypothetical protein
MPQFYFHIREQGQLIPDEDGMMLRDLEAARQEALKSCLDLVRNRLHGDHRVDEFRIEIADGGGKIIESVNVRDQVTSPGC